MRSRPNFVKLILITVSITALALAQGCLDIPWQTGSPAISTTADPSSPVSTLSVAPTGTSTTKPSAVKPSTAKPSIANPTPIRTSGTLDNTLLSWWFVPNDTHSPTAIDAGVRKIIEAHDGIYIGDTTKNKIYLTFDEGYENGYTASILDTLKANDTKAIFFITLPYLEGNPDLVRRMVDEGHQVGNHSVSHPSFPSLSDAQIVSELDGVDDAFFRIFGTHLTYFRPPMGEYSERTLEAAKQLGYKTVFWSFAYADWDVNNQKGADNAYEVVMNNHHKGAVYLLHAVSSDNAGALDRIIKDLKSAGYTIAPFDL